MATNQTCWYAMTSLLRYTNTYVHNILYIVILIINKIDNTLYKLQMLQNNNNIEI